MLSFEVWKNGKKLFTVGAKEAEEYGVYLSLYPEASENTATLEASGYRDSNNEFSDELRWGTKSLKNGDEVTIKISQDITPDKPSITKQDSGLSIGNKHSMLCSDCGCSEWETESMISMNKITLCSQCISSIIEISNDEK